ncbi:MAG: hypothetical protein L3J74_16175, partial [Bacteroidales bacterium]|nr:hypothetical protein [Bacteroidales bacterium]
FILMETFRQINKTSPIENNKMAVFIANTFVDKKKVRISEETIKKYVTKISAGKKPNYFEFYEEIVNKILNNSRIVKTK